jgi:two-component system, chemotaxis family, protein-glutamate methylesterase/glutaminase
MLAPKDRQDSAAPPIKVMIVDDSAVVRGMMQRWLATEADIEIIGVAFDGRDGVRMAGERQPDIIVLDVEMPNLDGLSAIPQLLAACPRVRILMASTLTKRNAEVTIKALALGATDYLAKPQTGQLAGAAEFRTDLIARIRALGVRRTAFRPSAIPAPNQTRLAPRAPSAVLAEVIVIGSSTGGPQALAQVLSSLAPRTRLPILIVQHMPAMFTAILADHLGNLTKSPSCEGKDGMPVRGGQIYVAPGDYHMRVVRRHGAPVLTLDQQPSINFCRPAVDALFLSAAETWGAATLSLVLTGMGSDGKKGAEAIVAKGGSVIAQDEATSVVWGMPGSVSHVAAAIKPLNEISQTVIAFSQGKK